MNEQSYLIRRASGRHDPSYEQEINLKPDHWAAKLRRLILPGGGARYIVPLGRLRSRLSFDGKPLQVRIRESGESITLFPKLQVLGLANFQARETESNPERRKLESKEAATLLCANLHSHYDEQIARLRARIDDSFVNVIGLNCPVALIDGIADHTGAQAHGIIKQIRNDVGVEVEWLLEGDYEIRAWIQRLQDLLLHRITQSFNEKSADNQFNLTYTCKIRAAIPSRQHVIARRARTRGSAENEVSEILKCVHTVLDPALGIFTGNVKVWLYPNFWKLLRLAFEKRVCDRIADEFGCDVVFDDFKRERTGSEIDFIDIDEDPRRRQERFLLLDKERNNVHRKLLAARDESGYDPDSQLVKQLEGALVQAEKELAEARIQMEQASQGRGFEQGRLDDPDALQALTQFHNSLELGRHDLLTLEAAR